MTTIFESELNRVYGLAESKLIQNLQIIKKRSFMIYKG